MVDKCYDNDYNNDNNYYNEIDLESNIVNNSANANKYDEMSVLIKHLENNWTIKKNIHNNDKNAKEYILKKNEGRDVKIKLIVLNHFETTTTTSKEESNKNGESNKNSESNKNGESNKHKLNVKLSDSCLKNFIYNALENEWKLKKIGNKYFCSKRHKGDKRVYEAGYLKEFLLDNFTF